MRKERPMRGTVRHSTVAPVVSLLAVGLAVAALGQLGPARAASSPFADIARTVFEADIEWLCTEGITTGCSATPYFPDDRVRRDEMASFLVRMFHLPTTAEDFFTDTEGKIHEANINRLAAAGVTTGCSPTKYCPAAWVRRDQVASFLARAVLLSVGGGGN
jgi:hypothetical protein